ncbi:MAG: ATP-binding protein [Hyphomicrobiales bacterium]
MVKIVTHNYFLHAVGTLAGLLLIASLGYSYATRYFIDRSVDRGNGTLNLAVAALNGSLSRYSTLPAIVADDTRVKQLLLTPEHVKLVRRVNIHLREVSKVVEAAELYLIDPLGEVLAASDFETSDTLVGLDLSYRPYFGQAMEGEDGRYFAVGIKDGRRGYYFAHPVEIGGKVIGVVAVRVDLESVEEAWRVDGQNIAVADDHGVIFMSGREEWQYAAMRPLSLDAIADIIAGKRYPIELVRELPIIERSQTVDGQNLFKMQTGIGRIEYLVQGEAMPAAKWTVYVLFDTSQALSQAMLATFAACLGFLLLLALGGFVLQRRARFKERMQMQREAREMLEKRVQERTADLNSANTQLVGEIAERVATERELRKTQGDLIQASKLAALGQMSAALSHEFNQPLTAIKSYAENAVAYMDRSRPSEARENVSHISSLTDRMAQISNHLRNFARKPDEHITDVPLDVVISDTIELMSGQLRSKDVELVAEDIVEGIFVRGDPVRLQQVLVNLVGNAIDAMDNCEEKKLYIASGWYDDSARVIVRDTGGGFADDVLPQVFDPFYTTKGIGKGLGLGLSISYNIIKDFGGNLSALNHPDGGAVFYVDLQPSETLSTRAAE